MAQWFTDTASISNLEITSSYIGSGSTFFNKSESILYINNGLRQGINNVNFNTITDVSNHIAGNNNSSTSNGSHYEGYNNTSTLGGDYTHAEGKGNASNGAMSHIEGEENNISPPGQGPSFYGYHNEGRKNTIIGAAIPIHTEGHNNTIDISVGSFYHHIEGINNTYAGGVTIRGFHIEGHNHTFSNSGYRYNHIEGGEHKYMNGNVCHLEGRNNYLDAKGSTGTAVHIEGYNNTITTSGSSNHICGVSCSILILINNCFLNGLGLTNYYGAPNGAFITGQFNTSNASSYTNISSTGNKIYYNFTVGGGVNDSTRKNIFEATLISSASNVANFPTRSVILPWVSESGNFASDLLAAAGGVPLGGFYRTGNDLKIRLS